MNDLDALLHVDPESLNQQEAMDNRFGGRPKVFEGDWDGKIIPEQEANRQTGEIYERLGFVFTNCKFIEAGAQDAGKWKDGESFTVKVRPDDPASPKFYQKELGRTMQDSGKLDQYANKRVRLTERAKKPWATADKPVYYYKWEVVGAGTSNGHTPDVEMSEDTVSRALAYIAEGQYTESGASVMLVKTMGPGLPAAQTSKFATGEFVKEMMSSGKLIKDGDTLLVP